MGRSAVRLSVLFWLLFLAAAGCSQASQNKASSRNLPSGTSTVSVEAMREDAPSCPVTTPNGSTPPGAVPSDSYHGNGALWTALWSEGRVAVPRQRVLADGSLTMKFPWWRGVQGHLIVEGRRLDAPAPPLRAEVLDGYGDRGFQATDLIFPTEGCWEVTGRVGNASLTFVTLVVKGE